MNLAEALADLSRRQGWDDRVAYRAPDRSVTHGQVHAGAAYAASILAGLGVARGDRVVIAVDDRIEFVWAFLGTLRLGAIAVPVDPALSPDDHAYVLLDTEPAAVVCAAELAERFESDAPVLAAGTLGGMLGHASYGPAVQVGPDAPAYGQYTSGATGHPKLALHRHGDPEIYFRAFGAALAIGPDDTVLSMARLHSAGGLSASLVFPLCSGGSALLRPGDRPVHLDDGELPLDGVGAEPTVLVAAPTWWARLLAAMPASPLPNLRVAVSTGETLTPALATRIRTWAGCPVLDGLVSTEVGSTFCSNTPAAAREGTVGRALPPYRVRVADTDGNDVPTGSQGTLWVRGPTVLTAYWGKPEATAEVMRDGWLRTGDLASVDATGTSVTWAGPTTSRSSRACRSPRSRSSGPWPGTSAWPRSPWPRSATAAAPRRCAPSWSPPTRAWRATAWLPRSSPWPPSAWPARRSPARWYSSRSCPAPRPGWCAASSCAALKERWPPRAREPARSVRREDRTVRVP